MFVVGIFVVGIFVGTFVVGIFVVGIFVVGTFVVGLFDVGMFVGHPEGQLQYSERIMRFNQQPVSSPYFMTERRIYFGI